MIKTVLTALLVVVLLLLLAVLSWLVVLYLEWPIWGAIAIFFGVIAVYLGGKALRRFYLISRSKSKLLASERAAASTNITEKVDYRYTLSNKYKAAVQLLKGSQLRRFGNPLYVLPWFMVMGESGSGKTTAIRRSRLTPMLREAALDTDITQTANCDWWFFSQAVVLDTAGRYVSPNGSNDDQEEWDYLLELFSKYRPREGLNGLVVVIDAPLLLSLNVEAIERRGQSIRNRVDQLMRLFEKRVPIYVMVTKCDQVYGFTQWSECLSDIESQEAMGYLSDQKAAIDDEQQFATEAVKAMAKRLEGLRLDLAMRGQSLSPEMLLLSGELERLIPGLRLFLKSAFGNNPYLEHPYLRGLFLTSALQQEPMASRLGELIKGPVDQEDAVLRRKGLFLHDVFARILPKERDAALPGQIVSRWRRVTANLALVAWLSLCLSALVFLVVSYQSTRATIDRLANAIPFDLIQTTQSKSQAAADGAKNDVERLNSGLVLVNLILEEEKSWRTRWLAFSPEADRLEDKLKQAYVTQFRKMQSTEGSGVLDVKRLLSSTKPAERAYAILSLTRYINLVQARVNGADYETILAMPQVPREILKVIEPKMSRKVAVGFDELLSAAIAWSSPDDPYLKRVLALDREVLQTEVSKSSQMEWLVSWANDLPSLSPIALADFWNPEVAKRTGVEIPAGLTLAGQQRIEEFLNEIGKALKNKQSYIARRDDFKQWYQTERLTVWQTMAWEIMRGESLIDTAPEFRTVIASIGTKNSPFALFFNRLLSEFAALPSQASPSWLEFARYYVKLSSQASSGNQGFRGTMNVATAVNSVTGQALRESVSQGKNLVPGAISQARDDITLFERYVGNRRKAVTEVMGSQSAAFKMADGFFTGSAGSTGASSSGNQTGVGSSGNPILLEMAQDLDKFKQNSRFQSPDDEVIWQVVKGPLITLRHFALEQASCQLQQDWEKDVMWKTQLAINPEEASTQLFGDQGSVWSFVDGPAKNFVSRLGGAFVPASQLGVEFPFAPGFVSFLNQAVTSRVSEVVRQKLAKSSTEKSAKLTLAALPLAVNREAKIKPYAALLFVQCDQKQIELSNVNMQASDSFEWSPGKCGEVRLEIEIDNMTLIKRYPGPTGLATLLEEFSDGARVFTPADFPAAAEQLDKNAVREITVRYEMAGREDILNLARDYEYVMAQTTPSTQPAISRLQIQVPARAGRCWTSSVVAQPSLTLPRVIEEQAKKKANPPPPPAEPPLPPAKPLKPAPTKEIVVKKGDTLFSIGRRYRVDVMILKSLNNLKSDSIQVGDKLLVPIWQNQSN